MLFLTVSPWWKHTVPAEEPPCVLAAGVLLGGARVVNKNRARAAMGGARVCSAQCFPPRGREGLLMSLFVPRWGREGNQALPGSILPSGDI